MCNVHEVNLLSDPPINHPPSKMITNIFIFLGYQMEGLCDGLPLWVFTVEQVLCREPLLPVVVENEGGLDHRWWGRVDLVDTRG